MKFKMRGNNVLLEPIVEERASKITIAEQRGYIYRKCRVAGVGPGKPNSQGVVEPLGLNVGDIVFIHRDIKRDIEDEAEKKEYYVVDNDEIRMVVG